MVHWKSSPHPISDVIDWNEVGRLELRPDFQRQEVWSGTARVMLMDTILRDVPMPKIFLASTIRDGKTYRVVIDGQQRISAILGFIRDEFSLGHPFKGDEAGKLFSELDQETKDRFLHYSIDFNEAFNPTDDEVREVYARVNKYTVPLNKQELRRADYPGDFLDLSEELAIDIRFDVFGLFTAAQRRRSADVEYVSELLAAMIDGIQDKKVSLDKFYVKYADWSEEDKVNIKRRFSNALEEVEAIFDGPNIDQTLSDMRFSQKSDFYSLFLLVDELLSEGKGTEGKDIGPLQEDLVILEENIRPETHMGVFSEYGIKCVSQANSASSRRWRRAFLKSVFSGTYGEGLRDREDTEMFFRICRDLSIGQSGYCPDPVFECEVCGEEVVESLDDCVIAWHRTARVRQLSNMEFIHKPCLSSLPDFLVLEIPNDDQSDLF